MYAFSNTSPHLATFLYFIFNTTFYFYFTRALLLRHPLPFTYTMVSFHLKNVISSTNHLLNRFPNFFSRFSVKHIHHIHFSFLLSSLCSCPFTNNKGILFHIESISICIEFMVKTVCRSPNSSSPFKKKTASYRQESMYFFFSSN